MSRSAPTLEDVARVAGVSRATVSRVVNGTRNVDPQLQETVRNAIEQTGYSPNRAARSLVTRRTGTVALVISGAGGGSDVFTDPFFGRVTAGVVDCLRPHGVHPVLMLADSEQARTEVVEFLRQGSADGALLVTTHPADPLPARLMAAGVPAVLYARPGTPTPVSYVDLDHRAGGRLAADHLVAGGRTNVVTISGPLDVLASQDRLAGFRDAMARHGFPYVPSAEGGFTAQSGEAAMNRLLTEHPDLDGVFAANDLMAQAAVFVVQAHGLRVPDDVAVVGFDDSAPALACRPQLTTVRQPVEEMAAEMAELLLADLEEPGQRPRSVIFEPELVVRASA
ncbi:LacI family DNA-binding transcriptional regulator [Nocardia sp. NRRL S-836]|uniref:LacI family DNA-binding transcriptional regulator n=1 Tax=Nocardia sp. NRRL S-836 TaxID=1519492 RepID=UPI0006AE0091|nr:LacI family DNA-binding transcriptional regulator [Nocardia sp. NRRL S-836]KOV85352.1 LacI family transcriptional regulator [Nocardia sp. NRRL S-836]